MNIAQLIHATKNWSRTVCPHCGAEQPIKQYALSGFTHCDVCHQIMHDTDKPYSLEGEYYLKEQLNHALEESIVITVEDYEGNIVEFFIHPESTFNRRISESKGYGMQIDVRHTTSEDYETLVKRLEE